MSDWKNRFARLGRSRLGRSGWPTRRQPASADSAALLGIYLLVTLLLGWYWSREPDLFPVQQHTRQAAEASQRQLVSGYTTVETLKRVASTLLESPAAI